MKILKKLINSLFLYNLILLGAILLTEDKVVREVLFFILGLCSLGFVIQALLDWSFEV